MVANLRPDETRLVGGIVVNGGRIDWDPVSRRIHELTQGPLILLGSVDAGWSKLYYDPVDGRMWELTFPQSEMHGGGPPTLTFIDQGTARFRYGPEIVSLGSGGSER